MLNLNIPALSAAHDGFLAALRSTGEDAVLDFARETLPDLVAAVGPETEEKGKWSVMADILKVVRPIAPMNEAGADINPNSVAYLVGRYRRSGRVSKGPKARYNVRVADYQQYRDRKARNVGITAAGYLPAARELGVSLPAWITENGDSEGSFAIERDAGRLRLVLTNEVPWISYLPGVMSRSGYAVQVKSGRFYDLGTRAWRQAAARSGF